MPVTGNRYAELVDRMLLSYKMRKFKTAEEFNKAFKEYVEWNESNPYQRLKAKNQSGGENDKNTKETEILRRPLSMYGLCNFLGVSLGWFKSSYKILQSKGEQRSEEENLLLQAEECAIAIIEHDQFEGAAVGMYSQQLMSRALGLADKTDLTSDGEAIKPATIINISKDPRCE